MDLTKETEKGRRIGRGEKAEGGGCIEPREKQKEEEEEADGRKKEKKRSRENSVTQRREKNQRRRRLRRSSSSGVNKIPPPKPPFLFGPPSLLPLEKYIESLLSFLSEEESEHRPKSLMRLEATRGELGRRSPSPSHFGALSSSSSSSSFLIAIDFEIGDRGEKEKMPNWCGFPKKNLTGKKEYEFEIKRAIHHSTICLPDSLTFIPRVCCPFFIGPILLLFDDKYAGLPATTKAGMLQPTDRSLLPHVR